MLDKSLPPQLIHQFEQGLAKGTHLSLTSQKSLVDLFKNLQTWHTPPSAQAGDAPKDNGLSLPADLVTLNDYWLTAAIQQQLLHPIDSQGLDNWDQLPPTWPALLKRQPQTGLLAVDGPLWGVPYRWGGLVIAYSPEKLAADWRPHGWQDLLHPDLTQQIILPDHPRLVLGLAQKAVGASVNGADPAAVPGLTDFLQALAPQVLTYSSDHYLEPLITGNATLVVGWSMDVLSALELYPSFGVVAPVEGTILSADLWVRPQAAQGRDLPELGQQWLDFCLSLPFAERLKIYANDLSPLWLGRPLSATAAQSKPHPLVNWSPQTAAASEFLHPLEQTVTEQYLSLWKTLRQS